MQYLNMNIEEQSSKHLGRILQVVQSYILMTHQGLEKGFKSHLKVVHLFQTPLNLFSLSYLCSFRIFVQFQGILVLIIRNMSYRKQDMRMGWQACYTFEQKWHQQSLTQTPILNCNPVDLQKCVRAYTQSDNLIDAIGRRSQLS